MFESVLMLTATNTRRLHELARDAYVKLGGDVWDECVESLRAVNASPPTAQSPLMLQSRPLFLEAGGRTTIRIGESMRYNLQIRAHAMTAA